MKTQPTQKLPEFQIPEDLIRMLRDRRVIPFIGAGFSAGLHLPNWEKLLERIAEAVGTEDAQGNQLSFDEIFKYCNGDHLQIAEYFFVKSGKQIGPLRQCISTQLQASQLAPVLSTPHVELLNLGSPLVYTTNYDEAIERTFESLVGRNGVRIVALPKDLAAPNRAETELVKYHGDLRYETSLVLTESSYYKRLDFDSPMDLKFRSDLLGRSVLFMGYSFRDLNIRIIWFKLMEMMKDVPMDERPRSFMVLIERNPVLQTLYKAVGLETIVLDEEGWATKPEQKTELLGRFLMELTFRAAREPGTRSPSRPMFVSMGLIDAILAQLRLVDEVRPSRNSRLREARSKRGNLLEQLGHRKLIEQLKEPALSLLLEIARNRTVIVEALPFAVNAVRTFGPSPGATLYFVRSLLVSRQRKAVLEAGVAWEHIWGARLAASDALPIVTLAEMEWGWEFFEPDDRTDFKYWVDVVTRIREGEIVEGGARVARSKAGSALKQAAKELKDKSILPYKAPTGKAPAVGGLLRKARRR